MTITESILWRPYHPDTALPECLCGRPSRGWKALALLQDAEGQNLGLVEQFRATCSSADCLFCTSAHASWDGVLAEYASLKED